MKQSPRCAQSASRQGRRLQKRRRGRSHAEHSAKEFAERTDAAGGRSSAAWAWMVRAGGSVSCIDRARTDSTSAPTTAAVYPPPRCAKVLQRPESPSRRLTPHPTPFADAMKIDKSLHDDYATLTLKGEFDTFYCPALMEEVEDLLDRGITHLILDMHLVKFINSTALGAVIKAHKRCRAEDGDLVVARPSRFVRDVMTKVGIDKLIQLHDDEASATKAIIKHLNQRELAGEAPVDQEKVLVTFPDDTRNQMLGGKKVLVGKIANVDGSKMQFLWNGTKAGFNADQAKPLFFDGGEMHLKFQVKMIKKSFFEITAEAAGVEPAGDADTVRVTAKFKKIHDADREALEQFAKDMAFLKTQLPGK
ncbi:MAG TPA: anti-sigma factor antagonist [bacterium]|nr:anti-sigma factor antagonist [bacterium]